MSLWRVACQAAGADGELLKVMAPELELLLPVLTSYNVTISAVTTRPGRPSPPSWTPAAYPAGTTISDVPIKDIQDRHLAALATQAAQPKSPAAASSAQNVRPARYLRTNIEKVLDIRPNLGSNRCTSAGRVR